MQSLGGLLAVLWCGAVGAAPAVLGSVLQPITAAADRSEATDAQWLHFEARLKALEASRARSGSEDAVRAASAVGTALPAVAATAATHPAAVLPAGTAVATAPQMSEDVLRQAQASLLSAISAAATFRGQQPSRPDERSAGPASTPTSTAAISAPTISASSTLAAAAAPPAAAVVATPAVQLQVTIPPGLAPGQQMLVQSPYGGQVAVAVPAGVQPGQTILVQLPALAANASAASDPTAGTLPAALPAVRPSTGAEPTGLGAVALSPQCPPWLVPPSPHCASLLAQQKTPTAAKPLAAATTAPPAASQLVEQPSQLVQQTLRLDEAARRQPGQQRGAVQQLDAIAASIASLAARDAPVPAIPTPRLAAASASTTTSTTAAAATTATAEAQAEAALTVASDEIAQAQEEILALAKSLEPLTEYRATTDPVELRSALRELDKEWEEEGAAEQRRQEEAAQAEQRRQEWLRERRVQAHAQAWARETIPT